MVQTLPKIVSDALERRALGQGEGDMERRDGCVPSRRGSAQRPGGREGPQSKERGTEQVVSKLQHAECWILP